MDIFSTYAVDESKEQGGVMMPLGDAKLLIARTGNKAYVKMLGKEVERHSKALATKDEAADKLSDKIMADVMAETILLGWENVTFKGAALEYSKDNARMVLVHKEFRREVARMADDFTAFKLDEADDQKN